MGRCSVSWVRELLGRHLRPYRAWIGLVFVLQFAQTMAMLLLPNLNARIIDEGILPGNTDLILRLGAVMLAIAVVQVAAAVGAVYVGARTAMGVGRDIRQALFTRVQRFSTQEISMFGAPSLITRSTNDVQQVQMLVLFTLIMILMAPIMLLGGVLMALQTDVGLSALVVVVVPALSIAMGLVVWWGFKSPSGHQGPLHHGAAASNSSARSPWQTRRPGSPRGTAVAGCQRSAR